MNIVPKHSVPIEIVPKDSMPMYYVQTDVQYCWHLALIPSICTVSCPF